MVRPDRSKIRLITECEQIEINESYKQLVGTANIRFPRGTVIKKTITDDKGYEYNSKVTVDTSDHGIVYETRVDSKKAELTDFKIGDRITIRLGYTEDPKIAELAKTSRDSRTTIFNNDDLLAEYKKRLNVMFEGYITKISLDTPIELQCENLASGLKRVTCPKKTYKAASVNTLFSDNEKNGDKMLEGTGLKLDPKTEECKISLGKLELTTDLQVSDILLKMNERGLYGFVQFDTDEKTGETKQPILTICRSYFSNPENDSILRVYRKSGDKDPIKIDFGYNVAENGLSLMDTDKDFMVVEATGIDKDGKTLHVTLRRNPNWEEGQPEDEKWQFLNETTESKKQQKRKARRKGGASSGSTPSRPRKKRWKMSEYTTIKFSSKKVSTTMKELKEEAKKYFEGYNMNGIEGSLTLFGDLKIRCADIVHLGDLRQPHKNGDYLVEEVTTKFGVNGFRQTLKLPYCLKRDTQTSSNNVSNE